MSTITKQTKTKTENEYWPGCGKIGTLVCALLVDMLNGAVIVENNMAFLQKSEHKMFM